MYTELFTKLPIFFQYCTQYCSNALHKSTYAGVSTILSLLGKGALQNSLRAAIPSSIVFYASPGQFLGSLFSDRSAQIRCTTPGPPTGSHGALAARSRIAMWCLRLLVVGRAGEAGDRFGLPRLSARTAEGITSLIHNEVAGSERVEGTDFDAGCC